MADIQYAQTVDWDPDMRDVGFVDGDLGGLAQDGVKITAGAPAAISGKWIPGSSVKNKVDGTWYENTGTTASPVWSLVPSSGSGITELTGDVLAGPGTGSQAATIADHVITNSMISHTADIKVHKLQPSNDGIIIAGNTGTGHFEPVTMSGDATIDGTGAVNVIGIQGIPVEPTAPDSGDTWFFTGSTWNNTEGGTSSHGLSGFEDNSFIVGAKVATTVGGSATETIPMNNVDSDCVVQVTLQNRGSNSVSVISAIGTTNGIDITFSGNPGADAIVNVVAFRNFNWF